MIKELTIAVVLATVALFANPAYAQKVETKFPPLAITVACFKQPTQAVTFKAYNASEAAIVLALYYHKIGKEEFIRLTKQVNPPRWEGREEVLKSKMATLFEVCMYDIETEIKGSKV